MLLQRSTLLHDDIQSDGCAIMTCAYAVNQYTNIDMTSDHINSVYNRALEAGITKRPSYINDWTGVFRLLGLDVYYLGHKEPEWLPADHQFEILLYYYAHNNWWHFVNGDGEGRPTYDPWGSAGPGFRTSKTVALGSLQSKRGFQLRKT